ncbi:hypothetical protein [Paenibacillus agricola]|uniref:Uncharacterized protein n=1 Tax=Paenibacillus agricola TaxID=2716264 RepID=A0ABX0JBN2_9BACL|nr:hypothetical protein [Paenibacillus agricola]NHN32958.1 hypothetical protein [Paenibacillus agricola]
MTNKQKWSLTGAVFLFVALLGLALLFESELFIYAASAIPILIVITLPDIRQNQYLYSGKKANKASNVQFIKVANGGEPLLVISFQPGFVRWHCRKLYFDLNDLQLDSVEVLPLAGDSASLSLLAFDLCPHPRKAGWFGIDLAQIAMRTTNLSYTTEEVSRFVIQMKDLEEISLIMAVASSSLITNTSNSSSSISA